jgi:SAM-dependent methyltransferase
MARSLCLLAVVLALALAAPPLRAQAPALSGKIVALAPKGAPAAAFPAPNRPVADIVSPIWHTEAERDAGDESGELVRLLGIRPGMTVADIGAGSGYHTVRLARVVGAAGHVIAQDVMPGYLRSLAQRVRKLGLRNVTLGLGEPYDPRLPPNAVDVALLVHMYHEVAQPYALLYNLVPALRSGAKVAIVDLDRPTPQHGTPQALLRCELAALGYREQSVHPLRTGAYLAVFAAPAAAERPAPAAIKPCPA